MRREIASLFPVGVVIETCDPLEVNEYLIRPEERALIAKAVEKRRREFAAGRLCARRALQQFGITDFALVANDSRAPIWPDGIVGSISHTGSRCLVAVARRGPIVALGVDVEESLPLAPDLWRMILTENEQSWLARNVAEADRGKIAKLIFSAKECIYKCHAGSGHGWLGFHDAEVTPDLATGTLSAIVKGHRDGLGIDGVVVATGFTEDDGVWVTAMTLMESG